MAKLSPMMMLPVAVFAGFAGLAGWALMRDDPNSVPSALIAREAPAVGTTTLPGKTQLTDEMLRQPGVKLVNFWASWCAPCRAEHPTLVKLQAEGLTILGVNYKDKPENAIGFLAELGNPYAAIGADAGRLGIEWGVYGVPETFVIDAKGQVILRHAGPITEQELERVIRPAIAKARGE